MASISEAPVLHVAEARGCEWRTLRLETVEDDAAMPPAHLVYQPTSGEWLACHWGQPTAAHSVVHGLQARQLPGRHQECEESHLQ